MTAPWRPSLGAWPADRGSEFRVWAPRPESVTLVVDGREYDLERDADGFAAVAIEDASAGARYGYRLDGSALLPDPASRFQPDGVHGLSEVVDPSFAWTDDDWRGLDPDAVTIYELHVGTFTPEGTFAAAAARLEHVAKLGVAAIEVMPVADFPGARNWGYDGVSLFAPSRAYGRPEDLRALVDRAHAQGLGVILDVVYNHFGPDGAYHALFSDRYFAERHRTPWGAAINLDAPGSEHVRAFFIESALHWLHEYHVDGFRLDAVHTLIDDSARHFLAEFRDATGELRRDGQPPPFLLAEEHRNLAAVTTTRAEGGHGFDAVYADDFHHEFQRMLTGHTDGFLRDYQGSTADAAVALETGWIYTGQHSAYEGHARGTDPAGLPLPRFMHCLENHDQVGNRAFGERLFHEAWDHSFRAATAILLFSAATPMLFQGDEWLASTPFLFFTDHTPELGRLVREGRRNEFGAWAAFRDPRLRDHIPDPQAEETFRASVLDWGEREEPRHAAALALHGALFRLRREEPALRWGPGAAQASVSPEEGSLVVRRSRPGVRDMLLLARLTSSGGVAEPDIDLHTILDPPPGATWEVALTTEDDGLVVEPIAPVLDIAAHGAWAYFHRPGAVILRAVESRR